MFPSNLDDMESAQPFGESPWPRLVTCGVLAGVTLALFGALLTIIPGWSAGFSALLFFLMAMIVLTDLRAFIVPDVLSLPAIPLRHIGGQALMELLDSFIARGGAVRAARIGNLILIRGTAEQRRELVDVVLFFDVDWMKSQTASIAILENGRPDDVASKLQAVFAEDSAMSGNNALKIIPVQRINGLIVIANSAQKVRRAMTWIRRLDRESVTDPNFCVYAVQNGNAVELARILQATFGEGGADAGVTAEVAPDLPTVNIEMGPGQTPPPAPSQDGQTADANAELGSGIITGSVPSDAEGASTASLPNGTRITPNPANNTLVIRATPREYRKIQAMLRQIDALAVQVMINTTIAEVALTDEIRYGVQAYFKGKDVSGGFFGQTAPVTDAEGGLALRPSLPGLNFLVGRVADPRLVIDALSGITKVRVVSSPSVLVLENETATIKVGDQAPVKTLQSTTDGGRSNDSFEYKDTGVILKVKPRVSANGMVTIDLGQELSAVSTGAAAGAGSNPTISQRTINQQGLGERPSDGAARRPDHGAGGERAQDGAGCGPRSNSGRSRRRHRQGRPPHRTDRLHHAEDHP